MGAPLPRIQRIVGDLAPPVMRAFAAVPPEAFVPPSLGVLAGADMPLPFLGRGPGVALTPSPRVLALLLGLLEPADGARVLVLGAESGYLGALAAEAGARCVRVVEPALEAAEAARGFVGAAGYGDRVEVRVGPPAKEAGEQLWDRVLLLDPRRALSPALGARIAELGFALQVAHTARSGGFEVVKSLRSDGALVELRAQELALPGVPLAGPSMFPDAHRGKLHALFALEELAGNAWRGTLVSRAEAAVRQGVEDTWRRPTGEQGGSPALRERRELARRVFHVAYVHQAFGDLDGAAELYLRSNAALPTSEAHTFLGWVRSMQGRLEDAMACCHDAIAVDPTLGNPYNDLGAYLLQLGRPDEAIPWLERALRTVRYDAPFFPHLNLARAYMARGDRGEARLHLRKALELNPRLTPAAELLEELDQPDGAGAGASP
jgi:protein-L-isoaspartate O-methyltransferase